MLATSPKGFFCWGGCAGKCRCCRGQIVEEVSQADATAPIVEEPSDSFDFGDDGRDAMGVMSVDAFLEEETSVQDAQGEKQGEELQALPVLDFSNMGRTAAMPPVKGVGQDDESVAFVEADGSRTTAMPAVSDAGNLDLDALRMAAEGLDSGSEAVRVSDSPAAVNPQAMYYNPPEDRSEELRDRARKERAVVTLTADEMEDMTVSVSEAEPMASAAQVVSVASSCISGSAVASEDAGLPHQEETAETSGDSSAPGAVQGRFGRLRSDGNSPSSAALGRRMSRRNGGRAPYSLHSGYRPGSRQGRNAEDSQGRPSEYRVAFGFGS
ncbi:MAG: hypothetical protein ACLTQI_08315 [Slackia sp.]